MIWFEIGNAVIAWAQGFTGPWGYVAVFLANLFGSMSLILPLVPTVLVVAFFAIVLNPWLVGIAAGLGGGIGELFGYYVGKGGGKIIEDKYSKLLKRAKKWTEKTSMFFVIFIFAATPLPADVMGIFAGITNYDIRKFLLAMIAGKIVQNTVVALAVFYGLAEIGSIMGLLGG